MYFLRFVLGSILLLLLVDYTCQDIQKGVDLVTKLSNDFIPKSLKYLSEKKENVIIGPFGLTSNLAMILEATNGKTRQEILKVLNVTEGDIGDLRNGFKAYCDLFLEHSSHSEAAGSFNSATVRSSFKLQTSYKDILAKHYCVNITEQVSNYSKTPILEFESDAGVMSHWRDYEKLAVYTFLSHRPLVTFKRKNNSEVAVPMIPQVGIFRTTRWENCQVILLPLQTTLVHLLLIVPDEVEKMDEVMNKINGSSLPHLVESLPKEEAEVLMPQLTAVSKNLSLSSFLRNNEIKLMFDSKKSDFTKAAPGKNTKLYLKSIRQNAYFSTSFNALNSVSGISTSFGLKRRTRRDAKKIDVDRPFLFFVLHRDTQLALLAGKIENPIQVPT